MDGCTHEGRHPWTTQQIAVQPMLAGRQLLPTYNALDGPPPRTYRGQQCHQPDGPAMPVSSSSGRARTRTRTRTRTRVVVVRDPPLAARHPRLAIDQSVPPSITTTRGHGISTEPTPEVSTQNLTAAIAGRVAFIRGLI